MKKLTLALLLISSPVLAQPAPQSAVQQVLIIDAQIKASLAEQLDAANKHIADLQKQLAEEKAKKEPKK